jgi:hypothetical protein
MNHDERRREIGKRITYGWVLMCKIFALLTPPIALPVFEPGNLPQLEEAAVRARALVKDLPLDAETTGLLDLGLLEWLTAVALCKFESYGPYEHLLDAATHSLIRHSLIMQDVGEKFDWFPES